jgi:DHA1 family inner membrane transport protein
MTHISSFRTVILVLLLWLSGLGAAIQFAKIAVPFNEFRAFYPDASAGVGWMLSIISLVGIFLGMTASILAGRFGYQRVLLFGILLGAAMSFWQAMVPSFSSMLISRLIEGISHLIIVVVAPTLIAQFSTDRMRGMAMTFWSTFFGVAFALIAWLGLPFVAVYGLSNLFIAHGIFMLVVAFGLLMAFRLFDLRLPRSDTPLNLPTILHWHIKAFRSPTMFAPALGWLFYTMTFVSLLAILPDTLPSESRTTLIGVLPLISIASALLFVSYLLSRFSAVHVVTTGFFIAAFITSLTLTNLPTTYIWIVLFAILGLIQGGSFAAVPELNKTAQDQALSNGVMAQMGNLGNTLGTPILLLVLNGSNVTGMMLAVAAIYCAGAFGHSFMAHLRRKA